MEVELVRQWVEQAVLGLGLCPFAGEPWHSGRVRLVVTEATSERQLLDDLRVELTTLDETDPGLLETTLLIIRICCVVLRTTINSSISPMNSVTHTVGQAGFRLRVFILIINSQARNLVTLKT